MPVRTNPIRRYPSPVIPRVPQKVPDYAPAGSRYNNEGKLVNRQGQLLNDKGQAINKKGYLINESNQRINDRGQLLNRQGQAVDDKGRLINENGHLINSYGRLINDAGRPVDTQGRLVNRDGRLVDPKGQLIDKDGKLVNKEGILIDKIGRPLDKEGKVARDLSSAAKGNNEPHEQLFPASVLKGVKAWQREIPAPEAAPKLTIAEVVTRMSDADKMVKAGIISTSPSGAAVARDAAIGAAVTGLVSAPINIGAYAGSTAAAEKIKAAYLPVPLTPPTPIAKSSVELTKSKEDVDVEALYPRMNEAQVIAFSVTNQSMLLKYGDTGSVLLPQQEWPAEPLARLKNLENMLDHAELHTKEVADEYEVYFKAYLPAVKAAEGLAGADARLVAVESRIESLQKAQGKVLEGMKLRRPA
ncbi:hypothetical protein SAMN04490205_0671 [Pseudomonas trivialis]|uniref:Filamentous hemagglutinin n=1 Tax=Pseudomonas trivialis TaxID=200450 RepID=A0ABY0U0G3_9PSED|nr:hypothetical protein SAMN04490205_0671 [Pseudomonas trivialis]